jgi:hypothetical protein
MPDELFGEKAYQEYVRRKAARKHWPDWTEVDGHGRRIFPPSNILSETEILEPPIAPRRKRISK